MSPRSIYFRDQADACRQHASKMGQQHPETQDKLRELADKFIVRAAEIESKE